MKKRSECPDEKAEVGNKQEQDGPTQKERNIPVRVDGNDDPVENSKEGDESRNES
jgi:hypothetical protein